MRISHTLVSLIGTFTLAGVLGVTAVGPATAEADDLQSLATIPVEESTGLCLGTAPTVDDVVGAAATTIRTRVGADSLGDYDRQVEQFRSGLAIQRVHRDGIPLHSQTEKDAATPEDPIVPYVVNGLDAVRTGRIDETISISRLTVTDVIEVFILGARVVQIPSELAAALVPTVGFVLKPVVNGAFTGVAAMARVVQDNVKNQCAAPNVYRPLDLEAVQVEPVSVPAEIQSLAGTLVRANGSCTPIAGLTTQDLIERVRDFLEHSSLPLNRVAMHAGADSALAFLRDNRVTKVAVMRRGQEPTPLAQTIAYSPASFLMNLGFGMARDRTQETVSLAEVPVENAIDLATFTMDMTGLLISAGTAVAGVVGVGSGITTPISMAQTLLFAPSTYGAPIVKGITQSMCAV